MYETQSSVITVQVWFIATGDDPVDVSFLFLGDVSDHVDPNVHIAPGTHIVTMNLHTAVNPESLTIEALEQAEVTDPAFRANFTTDPLQWVSEAGIPQDTPGVYAVSRINGVKVNIFACNSLNENESPETYPVRLITMFDGNIYWTPDPTMINLPKNP